MGKNKPDTVMEQFYSPFFMAHKQKSNPAQLSVAYIQFMLERIVAELCINRFNWQNLPSSVNTRFMEVCLYNHGLVVIFLDRVSGKLLAARAVPDGGYDMNYEPLAYRLMPLNNGTLPKHLRNLKLSARAVVPVWANALRIPEYDTVQFYTNRLAQTERTIDINLEAARATKFIAYDENSRLSAENINRMIQNGDKVIPVTKTQMAEIDSMIKVLDMGMHPEQIERLSIVRDRFWGNLMSLMGINNANQDKKERLVEAEVSGNDDQIDNFRRVNLNWRQKAAKEIALKWPEFFPEGIVPTVDYHTSSEPIRPAFGSETNAEEEDGEV